MSAAAGPGSAGDESGRPAGAGGAARAEGDGSEGQPEQAAVTPQGTVTGAALTSPGLGSTTEPRAAAATAMRISASGEVTAMEPGFGQSQSTGSGLRQTLEQTASERPEIMVGGAFVGAFLLAKILGRIVR